MKLTPVTPNPEWRVSTFKTLFAHAITGTCIHGSEISRIQAAMESILGISDLIPVGKGRYGIELALRAAGVEAAEEVIVPTFCCKTVLPPVQAVGALPVFADVDEELRLSAASVRQVLTRRTRAILLPHLFGNPVPPAEFIDLCRQNALLLIDDACQALGGTFENVPLGTFGDFGVWSFGYGKITFGAAGGFLYIKDPQLRAKAKKIQSEWPKPRGVIRRALAVPITRQWRGRLQPLYQRLPRTCRATDRNREYRPEQIANVDAAIALDLIQDLPRKLAARRARAELYEKQLSPLTPPLRLIPQAKESSFTSLVLSCGYGHEGIQNAGDLRSFLASAGYCLDTSYSLLHQLGIQTTQPGLRPARAESICPGLIELPVDPTVRLEHIVQLCGCIRDWLRSRIPVSKKDSYKADVPMTSIH